MGVREGVWEGGGLGVYVQGGEGRARVCGLLGEPGGGGGGWGLGMVKGSGGTGRAGEASLCTATAHAPGCAEPGTLACPRSCRPAALRPASRAGAGARPHPVQVGGPRYEQDFS